MRREDVREEERERETERTILFSLFWFNIFVVIYFREQKYYISGSPVSTALLLTILYTIIKHNFTFQLFEL